jgi:CheY-like chemotaxis protein
MRQQHTNGHLSKVLVVDDDDQIADVVREVLRDAGYSVATVRHGAAALELVSHITPDLILLDLSMPIMDGWSFVTQYRRIAPAATRILLLTGNPHAASIAESLKADGYIQKPFDIRSRSTSSVSSMSSRGSSRSADDGLLAIGDVGLESVLGMTDEVQGVAD